MKTVIDVFVSFSTKDKDNLKSIVDELRVCELEVWWSADSITDGIWDKQLENALNSARRVLAFISENVDQSSWDYIYEEIKRAKIQGKLIPIVIGEGGRSFAIQGIISRVQTYFFVDFDSIISSPEFMRLVRALGGRAQSPADEASHLPQKTAMDRIDDWFSKIEEEFEPPARIHAFAFGLASAIFENGSFSEVEMMGGELAKLLTKAEIGQSEPVGATFPSRSSSLLKLMECELKKVEHPILRLNQPVVRFVDRERAAAFVRFAWEEFGGRRDIIRTWLASITAITSSEGLTRIGFKVGLLAQSAFIEVSQQLIYPWLRSDNATLRSTADVALSVAAFEPAVARAVEQTIKDWATGASDENKKIAIQLACGLTGTRLSGSAIRTFRSIIRNSDSNMRSDILLMIKRGLKEQINSHNTDSDTSLIDLHSLIEETTSWVLSGINNNKKVAISDYNVYPLYIFLSVVQNIAIIKTKRVKGRLSLDDLMANSKTAERIGAIFNVALTHHKVSGFRTRDLATTVLRKWVNVYRKGRDKGRSDWLQNAREETLKCLAHVLLTTAQTQNDRDRILYLFGSVFSRRELESAR